MAAENDLVGLTLWRLRAAPPGKDQDRPRLLVQEGKRATAKTTHLKAERVAVSTTFSKDDPVQLSIEAHAEGNHYLYVIDREMYADGTSSEPYLIFPTLRTRGGDNFVTAGKLVDIPAATDNSPFQLQQPAAKCCWRKTVEKWERDWVGESEKPREASRLAGQECTAEEKASAIEPQRLLTQGDPLPQTIFRVNDKSAGPLLIVVPLRVNP